MAKKETKIAYGVGRSAFGDLWVAKVWLEPNGESVFADFDSALEWAKAMNDSIDNLDELENTAEEDLEILREAMHKWLI